jgi:S1-C subfamily serine protease
MQLMRAYSSGSDVHRYCSAIRMITVHTILIAALSNVSCTGNGSLTVPSHLEGRGEANEGLGQTFTVGTSYTQAVVGIQLTVSSGKIVKGSGALISPDGLVVTKDHDSLGAQTKPGIEVILFDGRILRAEFMGRDAKTNLAILKINSAELAYLRWANCENLKVEDPVLILNPLRPTQIATIRATSVDLGLFDHEDFIEVDGPFESKTFDGLLVSLKGELIGINAAWHEKQKHTGFTISCCLAEQITDRLIKSGKVVRASAGIAVQKLTPQLAAGFNTKLEGVLVANVKEQGAAYGVGVRAGDVILEVDGKPIHSVSMYRNMISLKEVGSEVRMKLIRSGQALTVYPHLKEVLQ